MALLLEELLSHLPDHERAGFLRLPKANQEELRSWIAASERLPRASEDLDLAPGTVSGPAIGRTRTCERGRVELLPLAGALVLAILLALPQQGWAHGGGLDRYGCHNETATGGYHCHDEEEEDVDWGAVGAAVGGAIALWLILDLMNDDEEQPLTGFSFTPQVGPGKIGFVTEYNLDGLNWIGFGVQNDPALRDGTYSAFHWRLAY